MSSRRERAPEEDAPIIPVSSDVERSLQAPAVAPPAEKEKKRRGGVQCVEVKYLVCCLLVVQNTGAVILMRYTRSMPGENEFITQTAVLMQECLKGLACALLLLREQGSIGSAWEHPREALKTSVPALLYLVQNNLQYVAVTYLDAATYTVSYQTKIVWSGALSVALLGRRLSKHKWLGIALLAFGVACVQLDGNQPSAATADVAYAARLLGMTSVISAAVVSALAGVYFEKILKGAKVGLWTRNLQLAAYSVIVGYANLVASKPGADIRKGQTTFFHGYTRVTWACIALNAFGGLLVGTVIRYADAVLKDVALGCSIVLSSVVSIFLFDFQINSLIALGIAAVIYAVFLYGERATCCGLLRPPPDPANKSTALADDKKQLPLVNADAQK
ncbi:hypothetical protein CTAYLR_002212 [Chrysophaeum taylorii]|uniref:UDP-galactose transporter n=1 Tax=Chrysophaeum taylorii TaxID=2483200 RepID=A0AAD7UNU5_9STRA|nr:hypothetical protein CTAYLR_002212 [Chrysophaeum taylorii]